MTKREFVNCIKLPKLTLKLGGIYLFYPKSMNLKEYINYSWFFFLSMLSYNLDLLGEIAWLITGARNGKSFVELTYNAPCMVFSILGTVKMYYLFTNKYKMTGLIFKLQEIYPNSSDGGIKKIVEESMSFLSIIVKLTFYLNGVLAWLFNLIPLGKMAYIYYTTGEVEFVLPYLITYPFNQFDIRIWPFIYTRQMWDGIFTVVATVGPDTLYYVYCSHIRMHFRILQYRIERSVAQAVNPEVRSKLKFMDEPPSGETWNVQQATVDNEMLRKNFIELIKTHQDLIELVMTVEDLYTISTLVNFISSSILICLTGFNIMAMEISQLAVFLVFFVSCLSQISMFCFFGNMVNESSMQVSDALYNSHWYLADIKMKKMMIVSLVRAQKACKLTALKFADVNIFAITSILGKSWSYFALLNTVYDPSRDSRN